MRFRLRRRLTAEEQRLADHTRAMGRVQGDTIIPPIPYITGDQLDAAILSDFACRDCGDTTDSRFSICDHCRDLDLATFCSEIEPKVGIGLTTRAGEPDSAWAKDHVPLGVDVIDGKWTLAEPRGLTSTPRRDNIILEPLAPVAMEPRINQEIA